MQHAISQADAHGLTLVRHRAVNPAAGDIVSEKDCARQWETTLNAQFDHSYLPGRTLLMSAGERGCAASHIQLWRRLLELDLPAAIIMEDDVVLHPDFRTHYEILLSQLPADYDILYLAYVNGYPAPHFRGELFRGVYVWTTSAYVLSNQGARRLLEHLPVDGPVDNYIAKLMCYSHIKTFLPANPTVTQLGWIQTSNTATQLQNHASSVNIQTTTVLLSATTKRGPLPQWW